MQITMIGCPFKTSYGHYVESLKRAIEKKTGSTVQWLASNCGCGDPIERSKAFQTRECDYFEMPHILNYPSAKPWKHWLRTRASHFSYYFRAKRYLRMSKTAEVVHFQQILNAYGSSVVFHWLNQPSRAARVVTIHELDAHQIEFPEGNKIYNKADGIIVHCQEMKQKLVNLKVQADRIHVVLHGTEVPALAEDNHREGIIFYGGHKLMTGKGIQTLFQAMSILKQRLGANAPILKIHGHYSDEIPEEAKQLALHLGIADKIVWLNQLTIEEIVRQYRLCILCVLPYTGSFAGLPAAIAAANGLPVVCTRKAGIPDHLGECGVWIDEDNAGQLGERIMELLGSEQLRREVSLRLRKRAKEFLSWDVIADRTLEVYDKSLKSKADSPRP